MCARPNGVSRHNHWFVFESALAAYTSYWKKTWMGPRTPKSFSCQVFRGIGLGGEDQVGGLRGSQPILFQPWTGRHKVSVCLLQGSQSSFCLRSAKVAWTKKSEASGNKRNKPDASEQNQLPAPATWLLYFPGFCDQWLKSPTHGLTKVWFRNLPKFSLPLLT